MLWKTHIAISNQALRTVGIELPSELYSRFKDGIIAPDQWKDYPHHYGKSNTIISNVLNARQCYIRGDMPNAYYYLGVALHYIQDAYTSIISYNSPRNQEWHHNYEQGIEDAPFVGNIEENIQYYFREDYSQLSKYSLLAQQLKANVEGKSQTLWLATLVGQFQCTQTGKPIVDRNLALKASAAVIGSVTSSLSNPRMDEALRQSHRVHEVKLHEAEHATSDKIIAMAIQAEQLRGKKAPDSGIIAALKNGLLRIEVGIRECRLGSNYKKYLQRKHLLAVGIMYRGETCRITNSEVGWYNFAIPELNLNIVAQDLVPIQVPPDNSQVVHQYVIGKQKVVSRRELNLAK